MIRARPGGGTLGAGLLLVLLGLVAGWSVSLVLRREAPPEAGSDLRTFERALAGPDLALLASVDLRLLRALEPELAPTVLSGTQLGADLASLGIDAARDLEALSIALLLGERGAPLARGVAMVGRLPDDLGSRIRSRAGNREVRLRKLYGVALLEVVREHPSDCRALERIEIVETGGGLLMLEAPHGARVAARLAAGAPPERELAAHWKARERAALSASVFSGDDTPTEVWIAALRDALAGRAVFTDAAMLVPTIASSAARTLDLLALVPGGRSRAALQRVGRAEPPEFLPELPARALPRYTGRADVVRGPFAVVVDELSAAAGPEVGARIRLLARVDNNLNLGERTGRARLEVGRAVDGQGRDLLDGRACAAQGELGPALFEASGVRPGLAARETLVLRPGARPGDVREVSGAITLDLPVRTTVAPLLARPGARMERPGVRIDVHAAEGDEVVYSISGETKRVLHVSARGRGGETLLPVTSREQSVPFVERATRRETFSAPVSALQVVVATQSVRERFPFRLTQLRPGTDGERFDDSPHSAPVSRERVLAAPSAAGPDAAEAGLASAIAGPFRLSLEGFEGPADLRPRMAVRAPTFAGLPGRLPGIELALQRVRLADGTVHRAADSPGGVSAWHGPLAPGEQPTRATLLTGWQLPPSEVESLSGVLIVRAPRATAVLELTPLALGSEVESEALHVRVEALGRDRFRLFAPRGGERILGIRAYDGAGRALRVAGWSASRAADGWHAEVRAHGIPARVALEYAPALDRVDFGFHLELAAAD